MNIDERIWDKLFKIKTTGRDDSKADYYNYPYEPTPYGVLERLGNSGWIKKKDVILDYGCGKGRVGFFLSYQTRAKAIGLDYDERMYEKALENKKTALSGNRVSFKLGSAEDFEVPTMVTRCYFFNPFSVEILKKVMARITDSYYQEPREILLIFYYPSEEYISYLMTQDNVEFVDEIDCTDLYAYEDEREKILIFQLVY